MKLSNRKRIKEEVRHEGHAGFIDKLLKLRTYHRGSSDQLLRRSLEAMVAGWRAISVVAAINPSRLLHWPDGYWLLGNEHQSTGPLHLSRVFGRDPVPSSGYAKLSRRLQCCMC